MGSKRGPLRYARLLAVFGLLLLLSMAVPVLAQSDDEPGASPITAGADAIPTLDPGALLPSGITLPTGADMAQTADGIDQAVAEQLAALQSPEAVAEREASKHAYADLSPAAAEELLREEFGAVLESLNNDPSRFLSDAVLERPLGETAAQVTADGTTSVMEGPLPVRTENEEGDLAKVDLGLEKTNEGWVPANPLVDVVVDHAVEEGVEVGDEGLTISQAGAEGSTAQSLGDKNIFFGEVEQGSDTDLLVSPTSAGVELFDLLRSVESPETLRFEVDVPAGAQLRATPSGGAEVVGEDEDLVAEIPAPRALDAQGQTVPVTLAVDGSALVVSVSHRDEDFAYPILVDPEVIDNWYYSFYNNQSLWTLGAWAYQEIQNGWLDHGTSESMWPGHGGLFFASRPGNLPGGQWGQYLFSVPNGNTYFEKGALIPFWRNNRQCSAPNPYPEPYDYDGMWYQGHWNESAVNLPDFNQANQLGWAELSWGQTVIFGVSTSNGISNPCWRDFGMMGLQLWLNDWDYPVVNSVSGIPAGWIKKGTVLTATVNAADGGLGVQNVRAFGVGSNEWFWNRPWCAGTFENSCPNSNSGQIYFDTGGFPYEGRYTGGGAERTVSFQAIDPTDKRWATSESIWLDGTPPTISLNGQLATITKQTGSSEKPQDETGDNDELSLPTYKLEITANDGADRSGVKEIKVFLDEKTTPEEVKTSSCSTAGCPQSATMNYTLRLPGLSAGQHSLRIVAADQVKNESDPNRNIEFEYIPATGMKEEYVLQHFRLPDGHDYSGEDQYHGPEVAVNVINGNVVFHERDVDIDTERGGLELERTYNSLQPPEKDTQWGRGWALAQTPNLEPQAGQTPPQQATVTRTGAITSGVAIPQAQAQTTFSSKLHASITKTTGGGYEVEPVSDDEVAVFSSSGRIEEVVQGDNSPAYLEAEEGEPAPAEPATYAAGFGAGGTGNGQFNHPAGIAIDAKANIWVVDEYNYRVEKFNGAGEFQSAFGAQGTGNGQFARPTDIAVDAAGNLWVSDAGNNRIQKFNEKGEFLAKYGSSGSGNGQFNGPESIAIDAKGNVWVGDTYNGRVQKFNAAGEFIKVVGSKGSGQGQIVESTGIDIGPGGNLWVADWGNQKVLEFNEAGEFIRQFGTAGTGNGQFARPDVIEVDTKGNVWVGDQNNGRVQQFNGKGDYLTQFGTKGSGQGQFTFSHPADVAVDSLGNLWVPDKFNNRIQKFNPKGEFLAKYGTTGSAAGQLNGPSSLAFDAKGNFWVAERGNNRIQQFNANGETLKTVGTSGSGNGQFNGPEGLTIDGKGNIWVSDTYNYRVQQFNEKGEFVKVVNPSGLGAIEPTGIDAAPNGDVWVTDWSHNRVVTFSEAGGLVRSFGTAGSGDGQFAQPDAVEVDGKGNVWVGDQNNGRVQLFNQVGEYVTQFGAKGSGTGQFSFSYPFGLASDNNGSLWVADANNNRVQKWSSVDSVGGGKGKVPAPYFKAPVVDYEYAEGKLTGLQLEDEATSEDPELDLGLTSGLVINVDSSEAGDTSFEYTSGKLTSTQGTDGQTKFVYDASGRMTKVTLPNGTYAEVTYDSTSRATAVKVDPAGPEAAKTTNFSYSAEPRRTIVWGGGVTETTYDIGEDGSVFKWAYAASPPTIPSISGSLWGKRGQEIENKDHTLFVVGSSPHQIASIKIIANGTAVVAEKTCEDPASPPSHVCEQPAPLEWITHASEHPPGRLDLEVVVTDFEGRQAAERFFVIVPQQPPPGPDTVERPNFNSIRLFREEYGLDRNKTLTPAQMNELILELLYEWERRDEVPMRAVENFGIPMRAVELSEMEWRKQYVSQAAEAIPQWAEEHASSTYGGFYVDDRAGGIIYVGFTGSSQEQAAQVEALKQSDALINPGQVQPYPSPPTRSVQSLEATQETVSAAIMGNAAAQGATVSISMAPEGNAIQVGATNTALVDGFLKQQFGQNAPISVISESPMLDAFSRFGAIGPIYGGTALAGANGGGCTAGFSSRAPAGQQQGQSLYRYFVLTAGHCYPKDMAVGRRLSRKSATALEIGKVRRTAVPPEYAGDLVGIDAEAILVDKSLGSHSVLNGSPLAPEPIQGVQRMKVGRWACWSGVEGGRHCGKIIRLREDIGGGGIRFVYQVNGPAAKGDSGAAVWDPITHKAIGSLTGIYPGGCWQLASGSLMCPRSGITPLMPHPTRTFPEGALQKLGVEVLAEG